MEDNIFNCDEHPTYKGIQRPRNLCKDCCVKYLAYGIKIGADEYEKRVDKLRDFIKEQGCESDIPIVELEAFAKDVIDTLFFKMNPDNNVIADDLSLDEDTCIADDKEDPKENTPLFLKMNSDESIDWGSLLDEDKDIHTFTDPSGKITKTIKLSTLRRLGNIRGIDVSDSSYQIVPFIVTNDDGTTETINTILVKHTIHFSEKTIKVDFNGEIREITIPKQTFSRLADANADNCKYPYSKYLTQMAESRAEGRCLVAALQLPYLSDQEIGHQDLEKGDNFAPSVEPIGKGQVKAIGLIMKKKKLSDNDVSDIIQDMFPEIKTSEDGFLGFDLTADNGAEILRYLNTKI